MRLKNRFTLRPMELVWRNCLEMIKR